MGLPNTYFEQAQPRPVTPQPQPATTQTQPQGAGPAFSSGQTQDPTIQKNLDTAVNKAELEYLEKQANRSALSYVPGVIANQVFDMPDQLTWDSMSNIQKGLYLNEQSLKLGARMVTGAPKFAFNFIKNLPKHIISAPLKLEQTFYDASMGVIAAVDPTRDIAQVMRDQGRGTSYTLPWLGEIRGFGGSYQEGIDMQMGPFVSTLKASGEVAGDVLMGLTGFDITSIIRRGLTSPRVTKVPGTKKVFEQDIRPLQATQLTEVSQASRTGKELVDKTIKLSDPKQNPNVTFIPLTKSEATQFGGNANNTFVRIVPKGNGVAEYSIVQQRKSLTEATKDIFANKFGRDKIIPSEDGPLIKLYSGEIRYNSAAAVNGASLPFQSGGQSTVPFLSKSEMVAPKTVTRENVMVFRGDKGKVIEETKNFGNTASFETDQLEAAQFLAQQGDDEVLKLIETKGRYSREVDALLSKKFQERGVDTIEYLNQHRKAVGAEYRPTDNSGSFTVNKDTASVYSRGKRPEAPLETPDVPTAPVSIMAKPLKGFENAPPIAKQYDGVFALLKERGVDPSVAQAMAKVFTGKDNIYDLTQSELYRVSEAVRTMPGVIAETGPYDFASTLSPQSYFSLNRNWMAKVENQAAFRGQNMPIDSQIRQPMETGIRLSRVERDLRNREAEQVFGKYMSSNYIEERRILSEYVKGNKDALTKNKALDETTKAELKEIGDWMIGYFKKSFADNELGLQSTRFFGNYLPELQKSGGIHLRYKTDEVPSELKVFAQFEREGQFNVLEDDALVLLQAYNSAVSKYKYIKEPHDNARRIIEGLPPNIQKATKDWVDEVMGMRDDFEKELVSWGKDLSKKTGGIIPENITQQLVKFFMGNSYAGALGFPRMMPVIRNFVGQSFLMPYAEFGTADYVSGLKYSLQKGMGNLIKEIKAKGFDVKSGVVYGEELSEKLGKNIVGKAADIYTNINERLLFTEGGPDLVNRALTYGIVTNRFRTNLQLLNEGKISWQQFEQNIDMAGFSRPVQKNIYDKFTQNTKQSLEEAEDILVKETLDRIQFGYRKGSAARIHHGLRGKFIGQFTNYTFGLAGAMTNWAARGQWDKLVRLLGMSTALKRTAEETAGVDISKWVGFGPLGAPLSPLVSIGMDAAQAVYEFTSSNEKELNESYKEIMRSMGIFGGSITGVGVQRWQRVLESIKLYEKNGPVISGDQNKIFGIYAANGKLIRPMSFGDLLLYGMGFSSIDGEKQFEALDVINRNSALKAKHEQEAMKALNSGDLEKFNDLYIKYQLDFNPADRMDSYQKGILHRVYDNMSKKDQVQYFELVQPVLFPQ